MRKFWRPQRSKDLSKHRVSENLISLFIFKKKKKYFEVFEFR